MRIGIDASSLRGGGGITHLSALLAAADPAVDQFEKIVMWGGRATLAALPQDRPWLELAHETPLDGPLPKRIAWQQTRLTRLARNAADVLFVPAGSYGGRFHPFVTMSRNMLPFQPEERARYGASLNRVRLRVLESVQSATFRRADATIFLSDFARQRVLERTGALNGRTVTIPHGVSDVFRCAPRPQGAPKPFRLLYVSVIDVYKFQWVVAEAVIALVRQGLPVTLDLVGPVYEPAMEKLQAVLRDSGADAAAIRHHGSAGGAELVRWYHEADGFVFASSCENMPNTLLEAMAAGLPIASSNRGPMPEILGDAGIYFDPTDVASTTTAIGELVSNVTLRADIAQRAYDRAATFSWTKCARATFSLLNEVSSAPRSARV
jgi:glycosyltransferase involved in cell wall biosynthesis